jgi:hypothetical protein
MSARSPTAGDRSLLDIPPMVRLAQQTITTRIRTGSASVQLSTPDIRF